MKDKSQSKRITGSRPLQAIIYNQDLKSIKGDAREIKIGVVSL